MGSDNSVQGPKADWANAYAEPWVYEGKPENAMLKLKMEVCVYVCVCCEGHFRDAASAYAEPWVCEGISRNVMLKVKLDVGLWPECFESCG